MDAIDAPFHTLLAHPSKWFAPRGAKPTRIIIHCTAATNPASSTAEFFHSSTSSGSTQAVADDDEGFTCVPDDAICAGAPPENQEGLHIEQPGLVTWSRATWLSHMDQIKRVAFWTAQKCKLYDIPVRFLQVADLAGEAMPPGITDHKRVSERWHQSTHNDLCDNYPWDVFMPLVQGFFDGTGGDDDMSLWVDGWNFRKTQTGVDPQLPAGKDLDFNAGWHAQDRLMALEQRLSGGGVPKGTKVTGSFTGTTG